MNLLNNKEKWMLKALIESQKAFNDDEVPVGAIVIKDKAIIGRGYNQTECLKDSTAHAEILALREASRVSAEAKLVTCDLYEALEPCAMCFGAMIHARIKRFDFGAYDPKTGVCGSCEDLTKANCFKHKINIQYKKASA